MIRNIAKCKKCGDIIESKHRHDFVQCSCGAIFVDGGHDYIRRGGDQFDEEFDRQNGYQTKPVAPDFEYQDMNTLVTRVWEWFELKGLKDPRMQMIKVQEEVGELAHQISRNKLQDPETEDALGDILVTVIGMCHHLHYHPAHALGVAYNEIKNRKGKVVEGSFVKDE